MTQNTENILQKKCMLVQFSAKMYTGRKKDKRADATVSKEFGNDETLGHYTKQAIPAEYLKEIQSCINEFRIYLYEHTLPWSHKGELLLSTDLYEKLMEKERECKVNFDSLVSTFVSNWESYIADARTRLNGLFNQSDYPSIMKVKKKFQWSIDFAPVPAGNNLKVNLSKKDIDQITADIESKNEKALESAMKNVWERVFDAVKSLSEKMKETRKDKEGNDVSPIFRDSIIGNIRDLVDLLPGLNITDDIALENARKQLENDLAGIDPSDLRESKESRQEVSLKADKILSDIGSLF